MVSFFLGPRRWGTMQRDVEGHREYKPVFLVGCTSTYDGPSVAITAPGLPIFGATYALLNDLDPWAWCRWGPTSVTPLVNNEGNLFFELEYTFSTKPPPLNSCNTSTVQNPLVMPPKISGGNKTYTEEKTLDRFKQPIVNSAFQRIRGPSAEFDSNKWTVQIEMNVANLNATLIGPMVNTVNSKPLWGFPTRCVKLSDFKWERKYNGACANVFYTWHLTFEMWTTTDPVTNATASAFDRDILDEGTKCIKGVYQSDPNQPLYGDYIVAKDSTGKPLLPTAQNMAAYRDINGDLATTPLRCGYPADTQIAFQFPVVVPTTPPTGSSSLPVTPMTVTAALGLTLAIGSGDTILGGIATIVGLDQNGNPAQEQLDLGVVDPIKGGSMVTTYNYSSVTSINLSNVQGTITSTTIAVNTVILTYPSHTIHVEYYKQSDFTLLGIPLSV
jgi:hypothetical protein